MKIKQAKISTILIAAFLFFSIHCSFAENKTGKVGLESKIELEKVKLNNLSEKQSEIERKIRNINDDIKKIKKEKIRHNSEFIRMRKEAEKLRKQIAEKEINMPEIKKQISDCLRMVYMREKISPIRIIYSSKNYLATAEVLNAIKIISLKEMKKVEALRSKVESLRNDKLSLDEAIEGAKEAYNKARSAERELVKKRSEMSYTLSLIKKDSAEYRESIALLEKEFRDEPAEVETTKISGAEEKKAPQNKEEGVVSEIISENESVGKEYGDFVYNRGMLMWPLKESAPDKAVKGNSASKGITLRSSSARAVQSVYEGKVISSGPYLDFQNLVVVSHGSGYYSVYGFDGKAFVNKGQKVYTGKVLGKINLDRSGNAKLYFQINLRGQPLEAIDWLKNIKVTK